MESGLLLEACMMAERASNSSQAIIVAYLSVDGGLLWPPVARGSHCHRLLLLQAEAVQEARHVHRGITTAFFAYAFARCTLGPSCTISATYLTSPPTMSSNSNMVLSRMVQAWRLDDNTVAPPRASVREGAGARIRCTDRGVDVSIISSAFRYAFVFYTRARGYSAMRAPYAADTVSSGTTSHPTPPSTQYTMNIRDTGESFLPSLPSPSPAGHLPFAFLAPCTRETTAATPAIAFATKEACRPCGS
ncbi:hypothetical protein BV20DRAFT_520049 [Pilatotrama ljubarskyi]|nr:hypothetical protein BV20DRAFT_520049 [Pilatotrama ljubarskyi]